MGNKNQGIKYTGIYDFYQVIKTPRNKRISGKKKIKNKNILYIKIKKININFSGKIKKNKKKE